MSQRASLSPVVSARFGMNQHPEQLGRGLLEVGFEFGLDVVDAGERQIVGHGAVAGDVEAAANFLDLNVVHIDDLGKLCGYELELPLETGVADQFVAGFDGGGLAFDVRQDVGDLRDVVAHIGFEFGDQIVGGLQGQVLVEFDVLLDVEVAVEILHADVVNVEVVASGDGTNAVEDIFRTLGAGQRLNGDVSVGENAVDGCRYGGHQLLGALEGDGAGEADGEVGEIAVAGAADTNASDFEHAID